MKTKQFLTNAALTALVSGVFIGVFAQWEAFTYPAAVSNTESGVNIAVDENGNLCMVGRINENEIWHSAFYFSNDYGVTWIERGRKEMGVCRGIAFNYTTNTIFLAAYDDFTANPGIYRSNDTCSTWELVYPGKFQSLRITSDDAIFCRGVVEGDSGIYRSTDGGENWSLQFETGNGGDLICLEGSDIYAPVWVSGAENAIWHSQNGIDWSRLSSNAHDWFVSRNVKLGSLGGQELVAHCSMRLFHSVNHGATWSEISFPAQHAISMTALPDRSIIAGSIFLEGETMVYRSENAGGDWEPFDEGIAEGTRPIKSFLVCPRGYVYAFPQAWHVGTEEPVAYRRYLGPSTALVKPIGLKVATPFLRTTLRGGAISITAQSPIESVILRDMQGTEVARIEGCGRNALTYSPDKLSGGVYVIHAVTEEGVLKASLPLVR